ncbi:MAG TPA: DUF4136 domain-containing protein [Vicinamibacterales bacterium]|nr:DUF4136 domain-containing protein [Vicinamibacterales bacterium]
MGVKLLSAVALVTLLLPATSFAQSTQSTRYDFDRMATFSNAKTYTLKIGTGAGNPAVDSEIMADIEAQLQAKGLKQSDTAPDLVIVYHVAFDKAQNISAFSSSIGDYGPYPYQWGAGWGSTDVRMNHIAVGTLVIDVIDAHSKSLIWRGLALNEVSPAVTTADHGKNIEQAVARILGNYPPKPVVMSTDKR